MLDFLKRNLRNGIIEEFLRDSLMLVNKFYYIGLVRFFAAKLLSKWEGPFVIVEVYHSGGIKIASLKDDSTQVVNGQRLKCYISRDSINEDVDISQVLTLEVFIEKKIQ